MHKIDVKAILSPRNELNIYRGCTYGCMYCDIKNRLYNKMDTPYDDLEVRENAISILNEQLAMRHERKMIQIGTMADPYNQYEEELRLTRGALEAIYNHGFGATIYTKSSRILDDLELLKRINERAKLVVAMAITTLSDDLSKIIEPKADLVSKRIEVLKTLKENGIPTVLYISPLIPYINDSEENLKELLSLAKACGCKGIIYNGPGIILRDSNKKYMYSVMDKHFPIIRRKYQREFKGRSLAVLSYKVSSFDYIIMDYCTKNDLIYNQDDINYYLNSFDNKNIQLSLFDE